MKTCSKFEHVSQSVYGSPTEVILLPKRATRGSAGYDFFAPDDIRLNPGESMVIKTGVRVFLEEGFVLMLFPRSGLGIKYGMRLNNTVGVIDSDYYYSDNQGHIMVSVCNCGDKALNIAKGSAFCQGVILPYGLTADDSTTETRNGGFGSTGGA